MEKEHYKLNGYHSTQTPAMALKLLLTYMLLRLASSEEVDVDTAVMLDEEKLLCLNRMIDPEPIAGPELADCQAAYDDLVDQSFPQFCDVGVKFDSSIEAIRSMIDNLRFQRFIDDEQNSKLKSVISADKCREGVSVRADRPTMCKTYSYTGIGAFFMKKYTFAYSCCQIEYKQSSEPLSVSKENAARKYATFLLKKSMIEKIGSAVRDMIYSIPTLPQTTETPLDPGNFTISI